jgi:hypothetical protein
MILATFWAQLKVRNCQGKVNGEGEGDILIWSGLELADDVQVEDDFDSYQQEEGFHLLRQSTSPGLNDEYK